MVFISLQNIFSTNPIHFSSYTEMKNSQQEYNIHKGANVFQYCPVASQLVGLGTMGAGTAQVVHGFATSAKGLFDLSEDQDTSQTIIDAKMQAKDGIKNIGRGIAHFFAFIPFVALGLIAYDVNRSQVNSGTL